MSVANFEPIFNRAGRRAIAAVLRAHPEWTLGQVCTQLEHDAPVAAVLRQLTLGELFSGPGDLFAEPGGQGHLDDGGPPPDQGRLAAARQLVGERFDECVCEVLGEVLGEVEGGAVGAAYLRTRVGGPRSKLQASLRRLIATGLIERSGTTSGTRYRLRSPNPISERGHRPVSP